MSGLAFAPCSSVLYMQGSMRQQRAALQQLVEPSLVSMTACELQMTVVDKPCIRPCKCDAAFGHLDALPALPASGAAAFGHLAA